MANAEHKTFSKADETRTFPKGKVDLINIGDGVVGRLTLEPGWKWSEHVKPIAGTESCEVEHVGLVLAGRAKVAMKDGTEFEIDPGDLFAIPAGHDSWVVGDEPYVSIHLLGSDKYAQK